MFDPKFKVEGTWVGVGRVLETRHGGHGEKTTKESKLVAQDVERCY